MIRSDQELWDWLEREGSKLGISKNQYAVLRLKKDKAEDEKAR